MHPLKYYLSLSVCCITLSCSGYTYNKLDTSEFTSELRKGTPVNQSASFKNRMLFAINKYYKLVSAKDINIEEAYELEVTSKNAAQALGLALVMGGNAPKSDKLFEIFYDTTNVCNTENIKGARARADLIADTEEQWPEFLKAIKEKNALNKRSSDFDLIHRLPFDLSGSIRVRADRRNLRASLYMKPSQTSEPVKSQASEPVKREFVRRKEAWQIINPNPKKQPSVKKYQNNKG